MKSQYRGTGLILEVGPLVLITIESGTDPSTVQITNLLQITNAKLEKNRSNCKPINRPCNLSNLILISRLKLEAY